MPISPNNKSILRKLALLMLVLMPFQLSAQEGSIEPQPAIQAPLADQSLMLDVIRHDDGFVAVGSRGHVLLSEDGLQWRQAGAVPVQATLTRVTQFGRRLWAVGHDATIISSTDAGETWFIQHFEPEAQEPLLDVLFLNPNEGFAIGAYGRFMTTSDGGINWESSRLTDRVTSEAIDWASLASAQGDIETMLSREVNLAARFMPHGLGHLIGLDTHDVGGIPFGMEQARPTELGTKHVD